MLDAVLQAFGLTKVLSANNLVAGLINQSYQVTLQNGEAYFVQRINTTVFPNPLAIQKNYGLIQQHLAVQQGLPLPKLITTTTGDLLYDNNGEKWRCFQFLQNTYSPQTVHTPEKAYEVAQCFGSFSAVMQSFDSDKLEVILPRFHDLAYRYQQFKTALENAPAERISAVQNLIETIEEYTWLVSWFNRIRADKKAFPLHIMHHDCKISNILFDKETDAIICPVDFDTTQAGLFFSDAGDMIRTMVPNMDENDVRMNELEIRPQFYDAVIGGYLNAMAPHLTKEEKDNIHFAGSALIYMQAIRFLADYLNGNIYYKTSYPNQNKDRTANQLQVLNQLQNYVAGKQPQPF